MSRVVLIFGVALIALMAGALFYAARIPVQATTAEESAAPSLESVPQHESEGANDTENRNTAVASEAPQPATIEVVTHPEFSLADTDGVYHSLTEWHGKNRILNFWATWCAPCRREIPVLKAFQDEQAGNGFQVIGIAVDEAEDVARYALDAEFNYPILVGQEDAMAVAETSGIQFMALPFTMFIASDGEYIGAYMGELHAEQFDVVVDAMTRLDRAEISTDDAREMLASL